MTYTDLILDLYGTLVDIRTEENKTVWKKTALFFGYHGFAYTADSLQKEFETALAAAHAQAGQSYECFPDIPIENIFSQLARGDRNFGMQAAQLFRICTTRYIRLYPGVLPGLNRLRSKGCRLWLLSNAQGIFTRQELQHLGLSEQFDGVYLSSDFGCRKPDQRFFRQLLETENLNPQTCLMIGNDRDTDITGAIQAGLSTLYLQSNITPPGQAPADPALHPKNAPAGANHWELATTNWNCIAPIIESL